MDQKFISGNFLPPPRGYPPIALLNNDHYPALRTSPLPFFQSGKLLKRPPLEFCSPFPHLNLVSSRAGRRNVGKGEKGNTSFLHQSRPASSGAVLTGQHSRLLTDLPATPHSPQFPAPPKYSPQFPSPHQHILLSSQKAILPSSSVQS